MVRTIDGQRTAVRQPDSIRLVRMVRTIGGQTWLHAPPTVCKMACEPIGWAEADLARWQRAVRPIRLAINMIHHPDEPDGVETRDGATTATTTGDCPGVWIWDLPEFGLSGAFCE